ncbi:MAG: polyvinylalcohol dehydrogenase [Phycisphaerales bacterium]|nr:polyvinylalcohol dehydrogenase [Phycisphaerales bacterium]
MTSTRLRLASLCLSVSVVAPSSGADNWPQYRGPERTGIVTEKGLAETWPEEGPKELWRAKAGVGWSSPVAADGKVYAFYLADGKEVLEALDAKSGKSLWKQETPSGYSGQYAGTRCTPVIQGPRIYTYGSGCELIAHDLADGKPIWTLAVLEQTGGSAKDFGNSSNPLIDGNMIYVQARAGGNAAVCVDKESGKIVWKSEAKGGGYATPVLADVGGAKQLICFAEKHLIGLDAKSGKTLWELNEEWETEQGANAAMPIVQGKKVFVTCGYKNARCGLYELAPAAITKVWGDTQLTSAFQAPILDNGYLYGSSSSKSLTGMLTCVSWADGKVMWPAKPTAADKKFLGTGGSIVRFGGDKLICLSERGVLSLVKATPQGMEKLRVLKSFVEGDQVWATPLIYDGKLYIKSKDELIAYDISAAK